MADGDTENKYAARLQQARQEQAATASQDNANEESEETSDDGNAGGEKPKKHKISTMQAMFMLLTAAIVDLIDGGLAFFVITEPLNWIVWLYAVLGFYIWLKLLGISWMDAKGKRTLMFFGGATGIEFIPYLNALPAWTAFVIGAIINDRLEEAVSAIPGGEKLMSAVGGGKKE